MDIISSTVSRQYLYLSDNHRKCYLNLMCCLVRYGGQVYECSNKLLRRRFRSDVTRTKTALQEDHFACVSITLHGRRFRSAVTRIQTALHEDHCACVNAAYDTRRHLNFTAQIWTFTWKGITNRQHMQYGNHVPVVTRIIRRVVSFAWHWMNLCERIRCKYNYNRNC